MRRTCLSQDATETKARRVCWLVEGHLGDCVMSDPDPSLDTSRLAAAIVEERIASLQQRTLLLLNPIQTIVVLGALLQTLGEPLPEELRDRLPDSGHTYVRMTERVIGKIVQASGLELER